MHVSTSGRWWSAQYSIYTSVRMYVPYYTARPMLIPVTDTGEQVTSQTCNKASPGQKNINLIHDKNNLKMFWFSLFFLQNNFAIYLFI